MNRWQWPVLFACALLAQSNQCTRRLVHDHNLIITLAKEHSYARRIRVG